MQRAVNKSDHATAWFYFFFLGRFRGWGRPSFFALICRNDCAKLAKREKSSGNTNYICRKFLGKT